MTNLKVFYGVFNYEDPPDWEYYKMGLINFVICIECEINKAKNYTFTTLAKRPLGDQGWFNYTLIFRLIFFSLR